ncbi:hypothetical protein Bbelb_046590 [Branchiostoma belcheri]|nr:hypothetical protein Bbelb_046590 [Branchiostoma belcheri]
MLVACVYGLSERFAVVAVERNQIRQDFSGAADSHVTSCNRLMGSKWPGSQISHQAPSDRPCIARRITLGNEMPPNEKTNRRPGWNDLRGINDGSRSDRRREGPHGADIAVRGRNDTKRKVHLYDLGVGVRSKTPGPSPLR